jgi:hypothetical protein
MTVRPDFAISLCLRVSLSVGLMLAATDIASAGTVSRDHRGANGASSGGVTVNGQKAKVSPHPQPKIGGPKWKGGYDALSKASGKRGAASGVTVRDHRTCGYGYGRPNRPCS